MKISKNRLNMTISRQKFLSRRKFLHRSALALTGTGLGEMVPAQLAAQNPPSPAAPAAPPALPQPRVVALTAKSGTAFELGAQKALIPLIFEGAILPQMIRAKTGERVLLKFDNQLDAEVSLHMRGSRAASPEILAHVSAKASAEVALETSQSGLFWLHPIDRAQMAQGLGALLVVEELNLPVVHLDQPFVVQDWAKPNEAANFTINGAAPGTDLAVRPNTRMRLRLVNACLARGFLLNIAGTVPYIVGIDGAVSEMFRPVKDTFPVGPGARFDLIFDVAADKSVEIRLNDGKLVAVVAKFHAEGEAREALPAIAALPADPSLPPEIHLERAQRAEIVFGGPAPPVDLTLHKDTPATLAFTNKSNANLSVYAAGQALRLLHPFDDGWEPYWRDSLLLAIGQSAHVALMPRLVGKFIIEATKLDSADPPQRLNLKVE